MLADPASCAALVAVPEEAAGDEGAIVEGNEDRPSRIRLSCMVEAEVGGCKPGGRWMHSSTLHSQNACLNCSLK